MAGADCGRRTACLPAVTGPPHSSEPSNDHYVDAARAMSMEFRERWLYHQGHPLKLLTDVGVTFPFLFLI
jgi:hypothetical protein